MTRLTSPLSMVSPFKAGPEISQASAQQTNFNRPVPIVMRHRESTQVMVKTANAGVELLYTLYTMYRYQWSWAGRGHASWGERRTSCRCACRRQGARRACRLGRSRGGDRGPCHCRAHHLVHPCPAWRTPPSTPEGLHGTSEVCKPALLIPTLWTFWQLTGPHLHVETLRPVCK